MKIVLRAALARLTLRSEAGPSRPAAAAITLSPATGATTRRAGSGPDKDAVAGGVGGEHAAAVNGDVGARVP